MSTLEKEHIGIISAAIVFLSYIPYGIRVWQRVIKINLTTWFLWSVIGFTIFITYYSSGVHKNLWSVFFLFLNPVIIFILGLVRKVEREYSSSAFEQAAKFFFSISLVLWILVRQHKEYAQYSLYLSLIADLCAAIPTIIDARKFPEDERPFMWITFVFGYGLSFWTLPDYSLPSIILPIYLCSMGALVALPLIRHRIILKQNKISDWI